MADKINKNKHRLSRVFKRALVLFIIVIINFNSFSAVVSSNDGSAFITKAEFDALVNDFNSRIEDYEKSIDAKIDGAIAEYLAGLATTISVENKTLFYNVVQGNNITCRNGQTDLNFVKGHIGVDYNFCLTTIENSDPRRGGKLVLFKLYSTPTYTSRRYVTKKNGINYWAGYTTNLLGYINASYETISTSYVFGNSSTWEVSCPYDSRSDTTTPGSDTSINILSDGSFGSTAGMIRPTVYSYAYREEKHLSSLYDYFYSGDQNTYYWDTDISSQLTFTTDINVTNSWRSYFNRASIDNLTGYAWSRFSSDMTTATLTKAIQITSLKKYNGAHNMDNYRDNNGVLEPKYSLSGENLSSIYYPDFNNYTYQTSTNNGNTVMSGQIQKYNMYAGVPLFVVTAGYEYEWPVKFLDTQSVDLYIKYEPFSEGVTESQCIEVSLNESKTKLKKTTIPQGGATVKFKAPESGLLFVKWKLSSGSLGGGTLDVANSGVYTSISST